jgi:hypothetical protein
MHDSGKELQEFQIAVEQRNEDPENYFHKDPDQISQAVKKLNGLNPPAHLSDEEADSVCWIVAHTGEPENITQMLGGYRPAVFGDEEEISDFVNTADALMSVKSIYEIGNGSSRKMRGRLHDEFELQYHQVSIIRGVLTQILHNALEEIHREANWQPVLWFADSIVYIGPKAKPPPKISRDELAEAVQTALQRMFKGRASELGRAAFGRITAAVVTAPDFLYSSDQAIEEFWKYVMLQPFRKRRIASEADLRGENERKLLDAVKNHRQITTKDTALLYLSRFMSDFLVFVVLHACANEILSTSDIKGRELKTLKEEVLRVVIEGIANGLQISMTKLEKLPFVANTTPTRDRVKVAEALWSSPYYNRPIWEENYRRCMIDVCKRLRQIWKRVARNRIKLVAQKLVQDVASPLPADAVLEEAEAIFKSYAAGKEQRGTTLCQMCGGEATKEAQAKLFGKSETFHDHLAGGTKVGGANKIKVCELCEFEQQLRSLYLGNAKRSMLVIPQLANTPSTTRLWNIMTQTIGAMGEYYEKYPNLIDYLSWASIVLQPEGRDKEGLRILTPEALTPRQLNEQEIRRVLQRKNIDLSLLGYYMEEDHYVPESFEALLDDLRRRKVHFKPDFKRIISRELRDEFLLFESPNFLLLLSSRDLRIKKEPSSCVALRWAFVAAVAAKLFCATVKDFPLARPAGEVVGSQGAIQLPSEPALQPLYRHLGAAGGWLPMPRLDKTIRLLASFIIVDRILKNVKTDYGRDQLVKFITVERGRILTRYLASDPGGRRLGDILRCLDIWPTSGPIGIEA